jgi:hypothetical protein
MGIIYKQMLQGYAGIPCEEVCQLRRFATASTALGEIFIVGGENSLEIFKIQLE